MKTFRSVESLRNEGAARAEADAQRGAFLRALDASEFAVDDWEAQFLNSFLDFTSNRPGDEPRWWTEGRRRSAERMALKYPDVARPAGLTPDTSHLTPLDLPSFPGKCDYLVRGDDRRQHRCAQAAVVKLRHGLELCAEHEQQRQEGIARLRKLKERQLR